MPNNRSRSVALGGVLAAVAVVIMCLGGIVPIATYVCPMLCTLTQFVVLQFCGIRIGWTWFAVVSVLVLLMGPDKEAVMVFLAIGYYPLIKPAFEKTKVHVFLKLLYFNTAILTAYGIMIYLFGMSEIATENIEFGLVGLVLILVMGNATFILLDKSLTNMARKLC